MPRNGMGVSLAVLVWRGIVRVPWRSFAGFSAALVAAGVFFGAAALMTGMDRMLQQGLEQLGADLLVVPPAHRQAVERWLAEGTAPPILPEVPAEWQDRLQAWQEAGQLVGVREIQPWDLTAGGQGSPATESSTSVLLIRLERWGQPMMVLPEVEEALPEAAVVVAEQVTRRVARDLQPLVRYLAAAAGVAWAGSLLVIALLAGVQVADRRAELGMLRAIGANRRALVSLVLGESLLLALAGAAVGTGLGLGLMQLAPRELTSLLTSQDLAWLALKAAGITLAAAGAAVAVPALQVARMDPVAAIQKG